MSRLHPCVGAFATGCTARVVQRCCDAHRILGVELGKVRVCTSIVNKSPHRLKKYNFESGGEGWYIKYYSLLPSELPQNLYLVLFYDEQSATEATMRAQPPGSLFMPQQEFNVASLIKFSEDQTCVLLRYCNQCHDYNPRAGCCVNGRTCQRRKPRGEKLEEVPEGGIPIKKRKPRTDVVIYDDKKPRPFPHMQPGPLNLISFQQQQQEQQFQQLQLTYQLPAFPDATYDDYDPELGEDGDLGLFGIDDLSDRSGASPDRMRTASDSSNGSFYYPSSPDSLQFDDFKAMDFSSGGFTEPSGFPGKLSAPSAIPPPFALFPREFSTGADSQALYLDSHSEFGEPMLVSVPTWEHTKEYIENQMEPNELPPNAISATDEITSKLAHLKIAPSARQLKQEAGSRSASAKKEEHSSPVATTKKENTSSSSSSSSTATSTTLPVTQVEDITAVPVDQSPSVTSEKTDPQASPSTSTTSSNITTSDISTSSHITSSSSSISNSGSNINNNKNRSLNNEDQDTEQDTEQGDGAILNASSPPALAIFVGHGSDTSALPPVATLVEQSPIAASAVPFAIPIRLNSPLAIPIVLPSPDIRQPRRLPSSFMPSGLVPSNLVPSNFLLSRNVPATPPSPTTALAVSPRSSSVSQLGQEEEHVLPELSVRAALFWWVCGGVLGSHHWYLRRRGWALLYLCTLGCLGFGWLMDLFRICNLVAEANRRSEVSVVEGNIDPRMPLSTFKKAEAYLLWLPPFGILGMHHFYLRRYHLGVLYVFTLGLLGTGWLVDGWRLHKLVARANVFDRLAVAHRQSGGSPSTCPNPWQEKDVGLAMALWLPPWGLLGCHLYYLGLCQRALLYTFTFALGGYGWFHDCSNLARLTQERNKLMDATMEQGSQMV